MERKAYLCVGRVKQECSSGETMKYSDDEFRRDELLREIEQAINKMNIRQLEALHYEINSKDYSYDE